MTLLAVICLAGALSDVLTWMALGYGAFFLPAGAWYLLMRDRHQGSADKP
jgi:hypothetical protein